MTLLRRATPERLSAFSDGVFAVLITVLVLELRPPELPTFKALLLLWPTWLSYAVSYLFIAIVWTNHHYLIRYAEEATPRLLWFNFAHLFSMSLLPLSTAWMAASRLAPQPVAFCSGFLSRKRNLHRFDLGTHWPGGGVGERAQDHAHSIDYNVMPFWVGGNCRAEIPTCCTGYLYLLPNRLSEARSADAKSDILGMRRHGERMSEYGSPSPSEAQSKVVRKAIRKRAHRSNEVSNTIRQLSASSTLIVPRIKRVNNYLP